MTDMSLVTNTLIAALKSHVLKHGTVVWYDPQGVYTEVARKLAPENALDALVHRYEPERGFLALRRSLEPHWNNDQPPRLILYVPLDRSECGHALIEFEVGGVVLRPGQQPPEQNTSLAAVARQALPQVFPQAKVEELVAQVEAGQLSLAELDELADKGLEGQSGVIAAIFGTGNAPDVALRFLAGAGLDQAIEEKNAAAGLAALLGGALGVTFSGEKGLPALKLQLARQILLTDFIAALDGEVPQQLTTFDMAEQKVARDATVQLAQQWRNRLDAVQSYLHFSKQVEGEVGVGNLEIPLKELARCQTFMAAEKKLQTAVEEALRQKATATLVELAETRLVGFWSGQDPLVKTRWEVIVAAGQVLLESARIVNSLKGKQWSAEALMARYAYGEESEEPWCNLDTAQRHLERDFNRFDLDPQQHKSLLQLVAHARQRYATAAGMLSSRFVQAYAEAKFELAALTPQTDVYHTVFEASGSDRRAAYLLVDALRYEMARELVSVLDKEWSVELAPALATPPTITEIGMAALMPGAEKGLAITAPASGKLAPIIDGKALRTRQERVAHFEKAAGGKAVTVKLEQLAPLTSNSLTKQLGAAELALVTATEEIDGLCETNPTLARRMLDDVLNQLRRGIKTLFGLGFNRVVITADHGYLFGEEVHAGLPIDPPGGETATLKRRVWVGKGGAKIPGTLRRPLSAFGIGGDLELVTPQNLAIFKVAGGSTSYYHGGLSLPELVIPVLTVTSGEPPSADIGTEMAWELTLGSKVIATRFLSVTVSGRSTLLLPLEPRAVRVEVRAGNEVISVPVSATDGFQEATKDVLLKARDDKPLQFADNTVTLQITDEPDVGSVTVHLLDATTGIGLQRIEAVPFELAL
jgi:hypothetical protein